MTNEQLLQQAKDQVAKDAKYASWSGLESICLSANASASHRILYSSYIHKAAELAIQSAREEGKTNWIFTSDSIPEPAVEYPDNSHYVLAAKGWSYAPQVVYYDHIAREFRSRETNAPVNGILFWTTLPDQPGINDKGKLTAPGR